MAGGERTRDDIDTEYSPPGALRKAEKRFGEAYEYRKKYSELAAFWHTDIGPLNEIIHLCQSRSGQTSRLRAEASKGSELAAQIRRVRPLHAI